eukprot:CAMPEP_0195101208 /NCGR_PEP_ID=MMETSP0448-20130528/64974_1 /TAXON_ID=66468 /ORGANISM="Heterocapsa triquestra, Strain CCMP 448" /LENGTH=41 /DNA_ID= /DNA_START= /DNA_END= /DNA_ORIENTATION=
MPTRIGTNSTGQAASAAKARRPRAVLGRCPRGGPRLDEGRT